MSRKGARPRPTWPGFRAIASVYANAPDRASPPRGAFFWKCKLCGGLFATEEKAKPRAHAMCKPTALRAIASVAIESAGDRPAHDAARVLRWLARF